MEPKLVTTALRARMPALPPEMMPVRVKVNTMLVGPSSVTEAGETATDTSVSSLTMVPVAALGAATL